MAQTQRYIWGLVDGVRTTQAEGITNAKLNQTTDHFTERIDAIEALASLFAQDDATTALLTWGWKAGRVRSGVNVLQVLAGTIALTASATNYVEVDPTTGAVSVNQTAFSSSKVPLRKLICGGASITTNTDARTWLSLGAAASVAWADITGKPSTFSPSTHTHALADLPVAASGVSDSTKLARSDDSRLLTTEAVQDIVGTMMWDSATLDATYDDSGASETLEVKTGSITDTHLGNRTANDTDSATSNIGPVTDLISRAFYRIKNKTIAAADIVSGVIATARLGSGTADSTKVLHGDSTWKTLPVSSSSQAIAETKRLVASGASVGISVTLPPTPLGVGGTLVVALTDTAAALKTKLNAFAGYNDAGVQVLGALGTAPVNVITGASTASGSAQAGNLYDGNTANTWSSLTGYGNVNTSATRILRSVGFYLTSAAAGAVLAIQNQSGTTFASVPIDGLARNTWHYVTFPNTLSTSNYRLDSLSGQDIVLGEARFYESVVMSEPAAANTVGSFTIVLGGALEGINIGEWPIVGGPVTGWNSITVREAGYVQQSVGEIPTGTINSSNTVFVLANAFRPGTTRVFKNGLRIARTAYSELSPNQIAFSAAPTTGDTIFVDYDYFLS